MFCWQKCLMRIKHGVTFPYIPRLSFIQMPHWRYVVQWCFICSDGEAGRATTRISELRKAKKLLDHAQKICCDICFSRIQSLHHHRQTELIQDLHIQSTVKSELGFNFYIPSQIDLKNMKLHSNRCGFVYCGLRTVTVKPDPTLLVVWALIKAVKIRKGPADRTIWMMPEWFGHHLDWISFILLAERVRNAAAFPHPRSSVTDMECSFDGTDVFETSKDRGGSRNVIRYVPRLLEHQVTSSVFLQDQ